MKWLMFVSLKNDSIGHVAGVVQWVRLVVWKISLHSFSKKTLRVRLDRTYFAKTENWKYCSKIIFKCMNSIVRPIFNEKMTEKWSLWDLWTMHECTVHRRIFKSCSYCSWTVAITAQVSLKRGLKWKKKKKKKKGVKRKRKTQNVYPNPTWKGKLWLGAITNELCWCT